MFFSLSFYYWIDYTLFCYQINFVQSFAHSVLLALLHILLHLPLMFKWLSDEGISHPLVTRGEGGSDEPLQKTPFPVEFSDKNCSINRVRQIMIFWRKKVEKSVPFQTGGHFTDFLSSWLHNTTKFGKNIRRTISTKFGVKCRLSIKHITETKL